MRYNLINTEVSREYAGDNDGEYKVTIYLFLKPIDNIAPVFSKDIELTHHDNQTGYEVDAQREFEINKYMTLINAI